MNSLIVTKHISHLPFVGCTLITKSGLTATGVPSSMERTFLIKSIGESQFKIDQIKVNFIKFLESS